MKDVKKNPYAGTKTEKNLLDAFAGESQARNKYTYFASVAKKAGYEQIAALFSYIGFERKVYRFRGKGIWVSEERYIGYSDRKSVV